MFHGKKCLRHSTKLAQKKRSQLTPVHALPVPGDPALDDGSLRRRLHHELVQVVQHLAQLTQVHLVVVVAAARAAFVLVVVVVVSSVLVSPSVLLPLGLAAPSLVPPPTRGGAAALGTAVACGKRRKR